MSSAWCYGSLHHHMNAGASWCLKDGAGMLVGGGLPLPAIRRLAGFDAGLKGTSGLYSMTRVQWLRRSGIVRIDLSARRNLPAAATGSYFVVVANEDVSALAVLAEVQADAFFCFRDAQAHDGF